MKCTDCKNEHVLNRRVTIQRLKANATVDAHGEVNTSLAANWETYASRMAAFKTRGGSERFASDMIQAGQTHRIYVRSDTDTRGISPAMRMTYGGRVFTILAAVDEDEARRWVVMDVVEDRKEP